MRNPGFQTLTYRFINYVEMGEKDSNSVWEMRNHPDVSKWMVNSESIPYESHQTFIKRLAKIKDKDYYLIKDSQSNIIGSVNIDYTESPYPERGIYINPDFFQQNHAYNSLKEFYLHAKTEWGVPGIMTKVKVENVGSNKLEIKLGAALIGTDGNYNIYQLSLE